MQGFRELLAAENQQGIIM